MTNDLIEEARKTGQDYVDQFNGDLKAVVADLRRRAKEEGRTVVKLAPRRPAPATQLPTKKAG